MNGASISLAEVEENLVRVGRAPFDAKIEAAFRDAAMRFRQMSARSAMAPTIVSYNLLLLADFTLLQDTLFLAVILHLFIISPALYGIFMLHRRIEGYYSSQALMMCIPLLIVLQLLYIFSLNDNFGASHYQYFISLAILFSVINMRPDFRVALAGSALMILCYVATVMVHPMPMNGKISGVVFAILSSYLALAVNVNFQRDARLAFLLRLREEVRFRAAEADAIHDPLTGLHNRRFVQEFARQFSDRIGLSETMSVILLDIDFFKRFNDFHGHGEGDACLRAVAGAIDRTLLPGEGTAVRYGGEEFLVLLPGSDGQQAALCAERIRAAVEAEAIHHGRSDASDVVTISLGVAVGQPTVETFAALIAAADEALYRAKAEGRNRVCTAWQQPETV